MIRRMITEEMIQEAMAYDVARKDAERGFYISISDYGNGATHIQRIDVMDVFASDWEAAAQAESYGIKIIRDMLLPEEHIAPYIDTPDNRFLLKPLEEIAKRTMVEDKQKFIAQLFEKNFSDPKDNNTMIPLSYADIQAKAQGIPENDCQRIEEIIKDAPDTEQIAFVIPCAVKEPLGAIVYIAIQTCDDGYDYTFYNRNFAVIDGGHLDKPDYSMSKAIYELLQEIDARYKKLELYNYETLREQEMSQSAANYIRSIEEQKSTMNKLPFFPSIT